MSTRATILIKEGKESVRLYHHHDGYIHDGVGDFLKKFLQNIDKCDWDIEIIPNELIKHKEDDEFEFTTCVHGDEEYFYEIDCAKKTLTCTNVPSFIFKADS